MAMLPTILICDAFAQSFMSMHREPCGYDMYLKGVTSNMKEGLTSTATLDK